MTTQREDNDIYKYNYDENSYNLISYARNKNNKIETVVYNYTKNKGINKNVYTLFNNTDAYYKIKTTKENILLIDNNDLKKSKINEFDDKNKYFMLINIDGGDNSRRFNIIPFKETPSTNDNIINNNKIQKIQGGQIIENTFYIINTYVGDIEKNFNYMKKIISKYNKLCKNIYNTKEFIKQNTLININSENYTDKTVINKLKEIINSYSISIEIKDYNGIQLKKILEDIKNKYIKEHISKQIINPLNNEEYGLIQQIIYILAEKITNNKINNYKDEDINNKVKELKLYDSRISDIVFDLIKTISNEIKNNNIFQYIDIENDSKDRQKDSKDKQKDYPTMINDFKYIVETLLDNCRETINSKILIYHSIINNQVGRSKNNSLLITYSLLTGKCIDEKYIRALDSSGYLSYYSIILNKAITDNGKVVDEVQVEGYLGKYGDEAFNNMFKSIVNEVDENYDKSKVITSNSIKLKFDKDEDDNTLKYIMNTDNKKSTSALYNCYNLHLYGIDFFERNIKNILCFDADLAEDSGNGRLVNRDNEENYHDESKYLTIYGKMNVHYMPPVIQIFNKGKEYILGVLEDEELNKWIDITSYDNVIKEIFHKHFMIIHISFNKNKKDDLYIYYKKMHFSYYNNIINDLFKIVKKSNNGVLKERIFKIEDGYIKYKNYKVNIYLGFNLYINKEQKYYNYLYNITNYKLNYITNNISKNYDVDNLFEKTQEQNVITFSNYANKRISTVSGYHLLYKNTNNNSIGNEIIEKIKKRILIDYEYDYNNYEIKRDIEKRNEYILLENEDINSKINFYIIAKNNYKKIEKLKDILKIEVKKSTILEELIDDEEDTNLFIIGYMNGYTSGYYKGYYKEENKKTTSYKREYKYNKSYNDGYNSGRLYGIECGEIDEKNKIKYNATCYKTRKEIFEIYYNKTINKKI